MKNTFIAFGLILSVQIPGNAQAQASNAVQSYINNTIVSCYKHQGESKCPLSMSASTPTILYLREAGNEIAFAFIPWQWDLTGNAMDQMLVIFAKPDGGPYRAAARLDQTYGSNPRKLTLRKLGDRMRIEYVGIVVGPRDSRINPRGAEKFAIDLLPNGQLQVAKTPQGRSMSAAMR